MICLLLGSFLSKRQTRATRAIRDTLLLYNIGLLNSYLETIILFQEFISYMSSLTKNLSIKYFISNTVTFAVVATMTSIQMIHKEKILTLQEIIKKSLLLRESVFFIPFHPLKYLYKSFNPSKSSVNSPQEVKSSRSWIVQLSTQSDTWWKRNSFCR